MRNGSPLIDISKRVDFSISRIYQLNDHSRRYSSQPTLRALVSKFALLNELYFLQAH